MLGYQRLRILECLNADSDNLPSSFKPGADEDIFAAFRAYVARMVALWGADTDPLLRSLLGAARLLKGGLDGAEAILDALPAQPYKTDHGAGYCLVAPARTLAVVLPVPASLADTSLWLAGSIQQAELRAWLAQQRERLAWHERDCVYRLVAQAR